MSQENERLAVCEARLDNHDRTHAAQSEKLDGIYDKLSQLESTVSTSIAHNKHLAESVKENKKSISFLPNIIVTAVITILISSVLGMSKTGKSAVLTNSKAVLPNNKITLQLEENKEGED